MLQCSKNGKVGKISKRTFDLWSELKFTYTVPDWKKDKKTNKEYYKNMSSDSFSGKNLCRPEKLQHFVAFKS